MEENKFTFLNGGGQMGQRTRQFNWDATSVGNPFAWPHILQTTVSILLNSKFPMFLLWGKDYIQFYNDAYIPSFGAGGKHPLALGQRGEDCWREIWPDIKPMFEEVWLTSSAIWREDQLVPIFRNGRMETSYWTFSYSPVFDEDGNVAGILSTCLETTAKINNLQQLTEKSEELEFAIDATELGTWDLNPDTGRFTANARLKSWFGLKPEEEIPLTLAIDVMSDGDRERVATAINNALQFASGGKYEEVYTIINPTTKQRRIVRAKGRAWFGADNIAYRFNGTLQDITEQTLAEQAQKEVEARFRNVSNTSPTGLWLSGKHGEFTYLNKTLVEWIGMPYNELLGMGWLKAVVEEDRQHTQQTFLDAVHTCAHYDVEFRLKKFDGSVIWCRAAGDPFHDEHGEYGGFAGFCMDIQAQKNIHGQIAESNKQLLNSFENSPVALATIDKENLTFRIANSFYGKLVGRNPEEIINKPLLEALPELKGQGFDKLIEDVIATGTPFNAREVAVDIIHNNILETIYVDLVYHPQYNKDGQITGVLVVATEVTEQVQSKKNILESEARFRSLIMEAPVATCLFVGPQMRVEVANDIMLSYWGKTKSVIGLPLAEALPELVNQRFIDILDNIYKTGIAHSEQGAAVQLEVGGELNTYYFDYTYKPLRNLHGTVYGIMDMAVDVTEQVVARKKLEESEQFARYLFYNSPVAKLVYTGWDMVLSEANEAMLGIFGRDSSIIGKPIMETIPELQQTDLLVQYRHVLKTGEPISEYGNRILLIKNGINYWGYYDYIYKALRNTRDEIYGVVCTAIDVTKEKTARLEIEAAEAGLRDAIEIAELATWSVDVATKKVTYSERLQYWLGIDGAELNLQGSPLVHPDDRERIGNALRSVLELDGSKVFDETYTIVNRQTHQQRIIHSTGRTEFDEMGNAISIAGTAADVTLQKQQQKLLEMEVQRQTEDLAATNEELAASNEYLRRSNEELSQYAYVASHDLQEPLRKIRVYSSLLSDSYNEAPLGKSYITKINKSAERMSLLINDLLEFSRLLSGEQLEKSVDLNLVAQDVLNDFELLVTDKKATVTIGELPTIYAVRLQMNQLFYNLINNSLKFARKEQPPVINISSTVTDKQILEQFVRKPIHGVTYYTISFTDNGIGFDNQYAEKIFDVFKRLHNKEEYAGSGIGLALCKRIATNHGGNIYATGTKGEGAVFNVILPERV